VGEYEALRRRLKEELEALGDEQGRSIGTHVVFSEDAYRATRNIAPDLSVFFGDLYWRSSGMVGNGKIHSRENDTGPDGANHNWDGIFLMAEGKDLSRGGGSRAAVEGLRIYDVAPTVLEAFRIPQRREMQGRAVQWELARAV
jgi:predicted AlkP superfamily phosphohydrolase/phosphomutase